MSLAALALRLQAIEAFKEDVVLARLVEGRVYDSRISALDHAEPAPVILVTTESVKRVSANRQNGGPPYFTSCTLVLEFGMQVLERVGDIDHIAAVETDRELEAALNLIEERILVALSEGRTPAAALLRRAVTRFDPEEVTTERFASDQTGERLGMFLVSVKCELKAPPPDDPFAPPTGPYAALPRPLRDIAPFLPAGSARATIEKIVAALPAPDPAPAPATPAFAGLDAVIAPHRAFRPDAPPDQAADIAAGRTVRFNVLPPTT